MALDLTTHGTSDLLELFAELEAPALTELDGEYGRRLLAQPLPGMKLASELAVSNPFLGHWLGKAFDGGRAGGGETGRGYNFFRKRGRVVRGLPMLTTIAPSRFDGRPAFQLVYRAFHSSAATMNMVDEIRMVGPGHYLGIGTWGFVRQQRMLPQPFELHGPQAPYAGDVGRQRADFDLQAALVP